MFAFQTIEDFFSSEVTTVVSDAPEWKLDRCHTGKGIDTSNPAASNSNQIGSNQLAAVLSPSPITPASNTTWSPLSVEDSGIGGTSKKGTTVAVSIYRYAV